MVEHVSILDADRHEPRGASIAALNQVLHSNGDGTTTFKSVDYSNLTNVPALSGYVQTFAASSIAGTQAPTALDTPLQVEFGPAITTTDVTLDAAGLVTFNTAGQYIITVFFRFGRTTGAGTAILLNRFLVNGVQGLNSTAFKLADADTVVPFSASVAFTAAPGDTYVQQIMRDSGGVNNGGLFRVAPTVLPWNPAPSATLVISKHVGRV